MDHMANNASNRFCFLQELYLYSNQLMNVPPGLSFLQLKILNFNRNQDLSHFSLGYAPLLETLSLSYCSFIQVKSLVGAPSLREFDISFNSIQSLEQLLNIIRSNRELRIIRYNDNPFSVGKEGVFDTYMKRIYGMAESINGNNVSSKVVLNKWNCKKLSNPGRNLISRLQ